MCKICEGGTRCISQVQHGDMIARVRLDLEFNQIDCQVLNTDGQGSWTDDCFDINYCPVCGKKLKEAM